MTSTNIAAAVVPQVVKVPIWPAASPSSTTTRSAANQHHPHQLKKQKSLIDSVQITNSIINLSSNMSTRRATFQKQLSVDQVNLSNSVRTWTNSTFNNVINNINNTSFENSGLRAATNISSGTPNKKRHQTNGKNE